MNELGVLEKAKQKGVILIAAAGNQGNNTDTIPYFPASYDLENIISVAGTTSEQRLFLESNHGKKSVDISAPGENIYSTLPGGKYGFMTGTSQATAFVTGLAAKVMGLNSEAGFQEVKATIENSGQELMALSNKLRNPYLIDVEAATHMRGNFQSSQQISAYKESWKQLTQLRNEIPTVINRRPSMDADSMRSPNHRN